LKETTSYKPAIIIPAYRRDRSLSRLLDTVNEAYYPFTTIDLIISLDYGASENVKKTAKNFDFKSGQVQIIEHQKKLGIKDHIMYCADYAEEFGSTIILEEDLIVAPGYYNYAISALKYYEDEPKVSGISIYSQRYNETAQLPFEPLKTEYTSYFMKLACSWGQAWTADQWIEFKRWYKEKDRTDIFQEYSLPENIKRWDDSSWKKFYNAYLIESGKSILYPYNSFSTHTGDESGEHIKEAGTLFQVPLSGRDPRNDCFTFVEFDKHPIKYDMYMEQSGEYMNTLLNYDGKDISVDLYGVKSINELKKSEYILSSKKFNDPIKSFPLLFKPIEMNIRFESNSGDSPFFYLYKTEDVITSNFESPNHYKLIKYFSYQNLLSRNNIRSYFKDFFGGYFK
jgi:hypothetical protein